MFHKRVKIMNCSVEIMMWSKSLLRISLCHAKFLDPTICKPWEEIKFTIPSSKETQTNSPRNRVNE